jgi:hypothetical protein
MVLICFMSQATNLDFYFESLPWGFLVGMISNKPDQKAKEAHFVCVKYRPELNRLHRHQSPSSAI